jgi:hypothetical protein
VTKAEKERKRIKELLLGRTDRRVLVVEGVDDMAVLRILLNRQMPDWETRWALDQASGKANVLAMTELEPDWLFLVDSDEAEPAYLAALQASKPNLVVLPRFCIESYACVPSEIWPAVEGSAALKKEKKTGGFAAFEAEILGGLDNWRRHASLWHAVNPLWRQLTALGFNNALLNPADVPDDAAVQARLAQWSTVLEPATVWSKFTGEHDAIKAMAQDDFLRQKLYAKRFYPQVVHRVLDSWLGQADEAKRRAELMQHIAVPTDLGPLWVRMT